jgi:hypothetical protein
MNDELLIIKLNPPPRLTSPASRDDEAGRSRKSRTPDGKARRSRQAIESPPEKKLHLSREGAGLPAIAGRSISVVWRRLGVGFRPLNFKLTSNLLDNLGQFFIGIKTDYHLSLLALFFDFHFGAKRLA